MDIYRKSDVSSARKEGAFDRNFHGDERERNETLTKSIMEKKNLDVTKLMPSMNFDGGHCDTRNITFSGFNQSIPIGEHDKGIADAAEGFFNDLNSIEDKVSQLFFLETQAVYDTVLQKHIEVVVEVRNLGGIVFTEGDFLRQTYLMECYSEAARIPLVICNGFTHGISIYLRKKGDESLSEGWRNLGTCLAGYFHEYGIALQMGNAFSHHDSLKAYFDQFNGEDFYSGLLEGQVLVGIMHSVDKIPCSRFEEVADKNLSYSESLKNNVYEVSQQKAQAQSAILGLNFWSLTEIIASNGSNCDDIFLSIFKNGAEALLFQTEEELEFGIKSISSLLKLGRISMLNFNRILRKILTIKASSNLKATKQKL